MYRRVGLAMAVLAMTAGGAAHAQASKDRKSSVKLPVAQAWIDVATYSGMGMPSMAGGGSPMAMLGGLFGGGSSRNTFGNTMTGTAGRWVDVTLFTRNNPNLEEASQTVPEGSKLAPSLRLVSPKIQKAPPSQDDEVVREDFEPPKGRIYLYWGCGDTARPGQPRVLDMSKAGMEDFQKFFVGRRATQRGAHLATGRPVWPNEQDARMVPDGASLVGEYAFKGQGVPDGFRFNLGAAQDLMAPIELRQRDMGGATALEWKSIPTARAFFLSAMGARGGKETEMVFWSSSELPDTGTGLVDYQTNPAVDRWLKEKVLLAPEARNCSVPKGIFGEGAMLRMIAYGSELNLVHPPRPADPKAAWEPQWATKVRVKSVANAMLGMDMADMMKKGSSESSGRDYSSPSSDRSRPDKAESGGMDGIGQGLNKLKGLFGF